MNQTYPPELKNLRMPSDLPYPGAPKYSCGDYGAWQLRAKDIETTERGYFTGLETEPTGHYIVHGGHVWMSTSRLERESHAVHLKHVKGTVVVCGVGMGMYLFNVAGLPQVDRVIAVDRETAVVDLVRNATGFEDWVGRDKISFVHRDIMDLTPADIGAERPDYLYIDIWPELADPCAIRQTQEVQAVVNARKVGWWGQELDFMQWIFDTRPEGYVPVLADLKAFADAIGLPMEEQSESYLQGCRQAADVFFGPRRSALA